MNKILQNFTISCLLMSPLAWVSSSFAATVGQPAPDFKTKDADGKMRSLSEFAGKWIVLEWHNPVCPFVKRQYVSGHIQKIQAKWTADKKSLVWLTVNSSAKGKEGYLDAKAAKADVKKHHAVITAALLDPTGAMGHAYDAKTTPHMFIINPKGVLVFDGALDNRPVADEATATTDVTQGDGPYVDYVSAALDELKTQSKETASSPNPAPYGCSVKYDKS